MILSHSPADCDGSCNPGKVRTVQPRSSMVTCVHNYATILVQCELMMNLTRNLLGFTLLFAGILGLVLPIVKGTPIIIAAVAMLGANHPVIRPWKAQLRRLIRANSLRNT